MKHVVTRFKSPKIALKELEPFIQNGKHLKTGKPFKRFADARSRELLANWLMCATMNCIFGEGRLDFTSDPTGSDGLIIDTITGEVWITEHVMALPKGNTIGDDLIVAAVEKKNTKGGAAYAEGKTLVVFAEGIGQWTPSNVTKLLPDPLHFDAVWVVGLHAETCGTYTYNVSRLAYCSVPPLQAELTIAADFESWTVTP
jgi:hypothetical protein